MLAGSKPRETIWHFTWAIRHISSARRRAASRRGSIPLAFCASTVKRSWLSMPSNAWNRWPAAMRPCSSPMAPNCARAGIIATRCAHAWRRNGFPEPATKLLLRRQTFEAWNAVRDHVEILFVDGEDRHLRRAEQAAIIEASSFQEDTRQAWPPRRQMRSARCAEFSRDRIFDVAACELFRRAVGVAKAVGRHQQEEVRATPGDVLVLAVLVLCFVLWLVFGLVVF